MNAQKTVLSSSIGLALHLEGTVSSVPVPPAAWLFGSGLAGLMCVARHRKAVLSVL